MSGTDFKGVARLCSLVEMADPFSVALRAANTNVDDAQLVAALGEGCVASSRQVVGVLARIGIPRRQPAYSTVFAARFFDAARSLSTSLNVLANEIGGVHPRKFSANSARWRLSRGCTIVCCGRR